MPIAKVVVDMPVLGIEVVKYTNDNGQDKYSLLFPHKKTSVADAPVKTKDLEADEVIAYLGTALDVARKKIIKQHRELNKE